MTLHLMKLAVGAKSVDDIAAWQDYLLSLSKGRNAPKNPWHTTRMFPKRGEELTDGGSLYWVVSGFFAARQEILSLEHVVDDEDGTKKCQINLHRTLVPVRPLQRRAFQGWRYLKAEDAPPDQKAGSSTGDEALNRTLAELGLL